MSNLVLDTDFCEDLKRLFAIGGDNLIAVIVCQGDDTPPEIKCFRRRPATPATASVSLSPWPEATYDIEADHNIVFPLASHTKPLFATACHRAEILAAKAREQPIEGTDEEKETQARYRRFWRQSSRPISEVFNGAKSNELPLMATLPRNPTIADLVLHTNGRSSINDRILDPAGRPFATKSSFLVDIPNVFGQASRDRVTYSNHNYCLASLGVEALWGTNLNHFMQETLFKPFGMHNSSLGFRRGNTAYSGRYTVDQNGSIEELNFPEYSEEGPEAPALGGYSSPQDMANFFDQLLKGFRGRPQGSGVDMEFLANLLADSGAQSTLIKFTSLGLRTKLNSHEIGCMSINSLQHGKRRFTTYKVARDNAEVYVMNGAAVGCSNVTAFVPILGPGFSVTILSNTSGPIDITDHGVRLVLRHIIEKRSSILKVVGLPKIHGLARNNLDATRRYWKSLTRVSEPSPFVVTLTADGTYHGNGFSTRLRIKATNTEHGEEKGWNVVFAVEGRETQPLQLMRYGEKMMKVVIPPHKSIDSLGDADWANLVFDLELDETGFVTRLSRKTKSGLDHFDRR